MKKQIEEKYPKVRSLYCEECARITEHVRISDLFVVTRPIMEVMKCQECGNEKTINYDDSKTFKKPVFSTSEAFSEPRVILEERKRSL